MNHLLLRGLMGMYGVAWSLATPVLRRHKRLRDGFSERLVPSDWIPEPVDIWIQAASGGEARLACALVDALLETAGAVTFPRLNLLVTTWTRQGLEILESKALTTSDEKTPIHLIPRFVPLDQPALMYRAMDMAQPRLVVLLETEIWPGLLYEAKKRSIPTLILNGRMTQQSLNRYRKTRSFWNAFAPKHIAAMADPDAERFREIFPETPVEVAPNIKFDQALPMPVSSNALDALPAAVRAVLVEDDRPLALLASVREEEEDDLCRELAASLASGALQNCRLIIAPRHMHRIEAWGEKLGRVGLSWTLRSELEHDTKEHDAIFPIYLWNTFGELPLLFRYADAVFVGGSLAPLGGQNFLEALAAGAVPCVGPYIDNFSWVMEGDRGDRLTDLRLLDMVGDASQVWKYVAERMHDGRLSVQTRMDNHARFERWLSPRLGGTRRQAELMIHMASASSM